VIDTLPVSTGCSAIFEYCITELSTGNTRVGQIMATWRGSDTAFTDYSTPDLVGSTSDFTWSVESDGTNVTLVAEIDNYVWQIRVLTRILF
jgi:hypothetical protein